MLLWRCLLYWSRLILQPEMGDIFTEPEKLNIQICTLQEILANLDRHWCA